MCCSYIILFLLLNNGSYNRCGCNNGFGYNNRGYYGRRNGDGRDCDSDCDRDSDRDCDRNRSREADCNCGMTPPPWTRSNYSNGDTCGCEEK